MAISGTITISLDIKSRADKFYEPWTTSADILPKITTEIKKVDIKEGEWNVVYTKDGQTFTAKVKVSFDNVNKSVTFVVVDGDLLKEFKRYTVVLKVSPKENGTSIVTWTVNFEKQSGNLGSLDSYLVLYQNLTKEVDVTTFKN